MKVLDLRCANGHGFEGWFDSEDDFLDQNGRRQIGCPLCADLVVTRMPSAPRLNLSNARQAVPTDDKAALSAGSASPTPQAPAAPADMQAMWLAAVRHAIANTDDVGPRFAEEARRIHYGETKARGIRGRTTPDEREALHDEGIEVFALPMPAGFDGPLQ